MSVTWATRGRTCWGSPSTTCCTPTACGSSSPSTGSVGRYNSHQDAGKGDRRSMRNCVQPTLIRLLFSFKFCLNLTRRQDHFKCALIASIHYTITITSSSSLEQPLASKASNEGYLKVCEDAMLTNPPVPYDLCVGVPISRLLTAGQHPFS